MPPLRVLIVGAGIGGLSAALALARQGASVTVIEKAPALADIGAGIQISPNASRVLHALGLSKDVEPLAFRPECVEGRTWRRGALVSHVPLGRTVENRFGAPYLHIHRADLLSALARAVTKEPHIDLLHDFRGWHPVVGRILDRAPSDGCYKWALFDRDPLPQWSVGAVTLLGDACHPALPFMAQGACMAIEDAAVLAACLRDSEISSIPHALQRYESLRKPRTTAIQTGSRANAGLYHMRAPRSWWRNIQMRRARKGLAAQAERLYGYDALAAATQPTGH